jgi:hypothetical protein
MGINNIVEIHLRDIPIHKLNLVKITIWSVGR